MNAPYTAPAVHAITQAARTEHDFAGWLASVLADAASRLGSADALTEGRPGSWEAELVARLVSGTVGPHLPAPSGRAKLTDAQVRAIRDRWAGGFGETPRELAADFGVSPSTISDITSRKTWAWLT
jgi:hypothetical protein